MKKQKTTMQVQMTKKLKKLTTQIVEQSQRFKDI